MGIVGGAVSGIFRGRAHRKLVHVGLADEDRAARAEAGDGRRVIRRNEVIEDARGASGAHVLGQIDVLDGDRDATQSGCLAGGQTPIGLNGLRVRFARTDGYERVDLRIDQSDPFEAGAGELQRGDFTLTQKVARFGNREPVQLRGHR